MKIPRHFTIEDSQQGVNANLRNLVFKPVTNLLIFVESMRLEFIHLPQLRVETKTDYFGVVLPTDLVLFIRMNWARADTIDNVMNLSLNQYNI